MDAQGPEDHQSFVTKSTNTDSNKHFIVFLSFFASIGGGLFGYDTGVVSGAMLLISSKREECQKFEGFGLDSTSHEFVFNAAILGATFGASMSGYLCDQFGRKLTLLVAAFLHSWVLGITKNFFQHKEKAQKKKPNSICLRTQTHRFLQFAMRCL